MVMCPLVNTGSAGSCTDAGCAMPRPLCWQVEMQHRSTIHARANTKRTIPSCALEVHVYEWEGLRAAGLLLEARHCRKAGITKLL